VGPVQAYIGRLHDVHRAGHGTPELSYRAALEALLGAVGGTLEPPVDVIAELADQGGGHPDFGAFERKSGNLRCAVEVKDVEQNVPLTVDGAQVARYWQRYGTVLVTNYRDFLLVVRGDAGRARVEARLTLAADADSFWRQSPRGAARDYSETLLDFLAGVLTRSAPISRPRDLAADLARHAREAKRRLQRHEIGALAPLQEAMEQALGLHFEGTAGAAFFRSSLVQTLFYGLFSGWMLWRQVRRGSGAFDWRQASEHLALPLMGDLYEEIARPRRLANLGLDEPLEWATASLNRVSEPEFFASFDADHAITLFYEPFLEAFDPELRKELGVWYTPPEIVHYMVTRVDRLLRTELGIADGLADEHVYVLDPACGTGSYIVEVARTIHRTLTAHGHGPLAAAGVKKALTTRVFGFEILPAPYVVAHLQLGVLLRNLGIQLAADERAEIYLTNALTGWEPPQEPKSQLLFPELAKEAERARRVKHDVPILVILGNPPYNRFAGVAEDEEPDLVEPYKQGLYENWGVRKQLLDDLYIRFFRLAEKRIAEVGERGIVCYISNYSWLEGLSHPVMREKLVANFDRIIIDNCNGDKYKTGKRTPEGKPDESMFTTDEHRIGIQVGTAITTLVRTRPSRGRKTRLSAHALVKYRDLWGRGNEKRAKLVDSLAHPEHDAPDYVSVTPRATMRWVLVNGALGEPTEYEKWPRLADLFPVHYSGLNENRGAAFITVDRQELESRLKEYFDPNVDDAVLRETNPGAITDMAGFDAAHVRRVMLRSYPLDPQRIRRLAYRPFDDWWCYWEERSKLLNRARPDFVAQLWPDNVFLSASQTARKGYFNQPVIVDKLGDLHLQDPWSQFFPLAVRNRSTLAPDRPEPNVDSAAWVAACSAAGISLHSHAPTAAADALRIAESIFYHALAVLWSPAYRDENAAALRQDWPRIPIPAEPQILRASADIGRRVADLLLPDRPVRGVTTGRLDAELRDVAVPMKINGGIIDPDHDLNVDAGWGYRGARNAVMCGKGRVERDRAHAGAVNVFLNSRVFWANVPEDVWQMTIGGYPVIKKWLSYREHRVLSRALRMEEVTYVTEVARRLKALLLVGPELDANYQVCARHTLDVPVTGGQ